MRWAVVLLVASLAITATTDAQEPDWNRDNDPYVAAMGLAAGYTSGTGLALRWPVLPQVMGGIAGGAWGKSEDLAWNIGFEMHYVLRQAGRTRALFGGGVGVYSDDADEQKDYNYSLGVGLEWLWKMRLALKFDVGFTYLGDHEKIFPLPQASLFYYF